MKLKNVNLFLEGRFVCGDLEFEEKILRITKKPGKGKGYLIPGLVDVHSHGRMGADFSDGSLRTMETLSAAYASCGVTSFLATTMSLPEPDLTRAMRAFADFSVKTGAKCRGIHLEGPFLSREKRGAHAESCLKNPDLSLYERLQDACGGKIKIVTVAPELPNAIPFIREVSKSASVSLGHTAADYDVCKRAFDAGARRVTHLFNAMPPLLHRAPGLIGAALDCGAYAELICDGYHVHPSAVLAAFRLFGEKLCLISDSVRCSGLQEGEYTLGPNPVFLRGGRVTLIDGTLAGSCISLLEGVQRAVLFGVPLETAVYAATRAPALSAGLDAGEIKVGACADLLLLRDDLTQECVFIDGKKFG